MDMFNEKRNAMVRMLENGFRGADIQRMNEAEFATPDNMSSCRVSAYMDFYHRRQVFLVCGFILLGNVGSWLSIISNTRGAFSDVTLQCLSGRKDHEDALAALAGNIDLVKAGPLPDIKGWEKPKYCFNGISDRRSKLVSIHRSLLDMDSSLEPFSSSVLGSAQGVIDFYKQAYDRVTKEGATHF